MVHSRLRGGSLKKTPREGTDASSADHPRGTKKADVDGCIEVKRASKCEDDVEQGCSASTLKPASDAYNLRRTGTTIIPIVIDDGEDSDYTPTPSRSKGKARQEPSPSKKQYRPRTSTRTQDPTQKSSAEARRPSRLSPAREGERPLATRSSLAMSTANVNPSLGSANASSDLHPSTSAQAPSGPPSKKPTRASVPQQLSSSTTPEPTANKPTSKKSSMVQESARLSIQEQSSCPTTTSDTQRRLSSNGTASPSQLRVNSSQSSDQSLSTASSRGAAPAEKSLMSRQRKSSKSRSLRSLESPGPIMTSSSPDASAHSKAPTIASNANAYRSASQKRRFLEIDDQGRPDHAASHKKKRLENGAAQLPTPSPTSPDGDAPGNDGATASIELKQLSAPPRENSSNPVPPKSMTTTQQSGGSIESVCGCAASGSMKLQMAALKQMSTLQQTEPNCGNKKKKILNDQVSELLKENAEIQSHNVQLLAANKAAQQSSASHEKNASHWEKKYELEAEKLQKLEVAMKKKRQESLDNQENAIKQLYEVIAKSQESAEAAERSFAIYCKELREQHENLIHKLSKDQEDELQERDNQLKDMNNQLKDMNNQLLKRDNQVKEKDNQVKEKDCQLQEKVNQVKEKDCQLQGKVNQVKEKDKQLQEKVNQLQEKDKQLQEKVNQLQEKVNQVKEKDCQLQGKVNQLKEKDKQLQEKENQLQEKDIQLHDVSSKYQKAQDTTNSGKADIENLKTEMEKLQEEARNNTTSLHAKLEEQEQEWNKMRLDLESQHGAEKEKVTMLNEDLAHTKDSMGRLQIELNEASIQLAIKDEKLRKSQAHQNALKEDLNKEVTRSHEGAASNEELNGKLTTAQAEIEGLERKINDLQHELGYYKRNMSLAKQNAEARTPKIYKQIRERQLLTRMGMCGGESMFTRSCGPRQ